VSEKSLPPVLPYHPTTFLERGVAIPFTTPLLGGTRARPATKQGLELVIPNPSGGPGVYIMAWTRISSICCPTLHDRQLNERIATLNSVTPGTIRRVGREVAAEGLAGEEAMDAARKAAEHDKGDRLVANNLLLTALVGQVDVPLEPQTAADVPDPTEMQQRARHAVDIVATRLGRSANWVAAALEAIADAMASIGINRSSTNSHVPRLVGLLQHCSTEVAASSSAQHSDDQASYAEMICSVADFTLKLAESTLVNARALTNDVVALLRSWAVDPESIVRLAGRPEWLLDGWEQICLLWEVAEGDAARRAALIEMVQLVPVLPREAREWSALVLEAEISARLRRLIPLNQDWRTGATVFDRIARNEHMRALACYGDVEAPTQ
jgi:hypothetical protein